MTRKQLTPLLTRGLQFALDITTLVLAFTLAYLLRFEFAVPAPELGPRGRAASLRGAHPVRGALPRRRLQLHLALRRDARGQAFVYAALWSGLVLVVLRLSLPDRFAGVEDPDLGHSHGHGPGVRRRPRAARPPPVPLRAFGAPRPRRLCGRCERRRPLLIGAGRAGVLAAREIAGRGDIDLDVQGFVDDDSDKKGAVIHGVRVLGTTEDLPRLVRELEIEQVVITIAQISRPEILRIIDLCRKIPVNVRIIPGLYEILQGKVQVTRIRDVEIEDLLGREPVQLDEEQLGPVPRRQAGHGDRRGRLDRLGARAPGRAVRPREAPPGRAGGVRALRDRQRAAPGRARRPRSMPLVADVGDESRMRALFAAYAPQVVFHAAAHKHVPMMESNPGEAVKNNVLGTQLAGRARGRARRRGVRPDLDRQGRQPDVGHGRDQAGRRDRPPGPATAYDTRFVAVRFGNVLGSAGSVVPDLPGADRARRPGHRHAPGDEALLHDDPRGRAARAAGRRDGAGRRDLHPRHGRAGAIVDLADDDDHAVRPAAPTRTSRSSFTGLRPGEKLFEELELAGEEIAKTRHPKILIGKLGALPPDEFNRALRILEELARDGDGTAVRKFLNSLLPEANLSVRRATREVAPSNEPVVETRQTPPDA